MEKTKSAVFDAGPFIHLTEIKQLNLTSQYPSILTTIEILEECQNIRNEIEKIHSISIKPLLAASKDFAKYLIDQYDLHLGESTGIALCKQEHIPLFYTDDLDAREVAHALGFSPHGTLALLLRAYRKKILTRIQVEKAVYQLYTTSSLFLTKDLYQWTLQEIERYNSNNKS